MKATLDLFPHHHHPLQAIVVCHKRKKEEKEREEVVVFKNITGVTPKSYGDKCWQFIVKQERKEKSVSKRSSIIINSQIANPTLCNESGDEDKTSEDTLSSRKRKGEIIESCNENKRLDTEGKIYQRLDFNNDTNLPTNVHIDGSNLSSSSPSTASSSVSSAYSRFSSQSPIESDTFVELFKSPTEFQQQLATSLSENPTGSDSQVSYKVYKSNSMCKYNNIRHNSIIILTNLKFSLMVH
ncbi:unnamed protein product [[Candida] boidinii]|uniref:Unnamed protein product n=1 Tax=Candida boidinii TaxID=5477 RepID=A0ACB5U2S6_CANBO|nr:unnamed protein product [[Candida] boidinii]